MDPSAYEWCFSSQELGKDGPNEHSFQNVRALLDEWSAGSLLFEGAHVRRLAPKKNGIWELKTKPERHSVRLFGWFVQPKIILIVLAKFKNDVSAGCKDEIEFILRYRSNLNLDEPKVTRENDYASLVQV
ncbi:hypothetical protein [Rhodovibrio salinarum]|uniref:hypothetical protein n=1 Tax=Rhodovibrio salinarum TaxID=1087 RepID=UPI0014714394|nr:hypothetical protein [Rhodovibrio salinarum]